MTSSAVVGSSAIRSFGSLASAIAIMRALPHAAGELVRISFRASAGAGDADAVEHLDRVTPRRASRSAR